MTKEQLKKNRQTIELFEKVMNKAKEKTIILKEKLKAFK